MMREAFLQEADQVTADSEMIDAVVSREDKSSIKFYPYIMFLGLYQYLKQLPLTVRLCAGLALGAVFILLVCLLIGNYLSVPSEANFLPADCALYLRVNNNANDKINRLSDRIISDFGFLDIYKSANTGIFSVCQMPSGESLIYIKAKDKSIEPSIASSGFAYKKISKGRYIISKSSEKLSLKNKHKLSPEIIGRYGAHDDLFARLSPEFIASNNPKLFSAFCSGKDTCFIRGKVYGDYLKLFSGSDNGMKIKNESIGDFDFIYRSMTDQAFCRNNNSATKIDVPLWAQLIGKDGYDGFICADYALALKYQADASSSPSVWQQYQIYLSLNTKSEFNDSQKADLENYLKRSIAFLFPFTEEVRLSDGTKVSEIKIDPAKLSFEATSTYKFLNFPDDSATIYYNTDHQSAIISNNLGFLNSGFLNSKEQGSFLITNSKFLKDSGFGDFLWLFDLVVVKNNAIYLK